MPRLITDYLDPAAVVCPDKPAFVDEQRTLTFAALRHEARCVAAALLERGLCREPVALYLPKCVECVVCFLGTALSGNFHSLIDVGMPRPRVQQMTDVLQPRAVLADIAHADAARAVFGCDILIYEQIVGRDFVDSILPDSPKISDTDPLCVLFTSGSTGKPKGVVLSHRSAVDNVAFFSISYGIDGDNVFGSLSPLYHALSLREIFGTIANTCTTHLMAPHYGIYPMEFMKYLSMFDVNSIVCVPTMMRHIAFSGLLDKNLHLPALKRIISGGERLDPEVLRVWRKAFPDAVFFQEYGCTEAGGGCSYAQVDRAFGADEPIPIGRAGIDNRLLVLNAVNEPVRLEETGEICVCGSCLASGYYRNPEQTSKSFVQNPLHSGPEIIYRTGDLGYYNDRGELFYAGRKDMQIKHRGYRIEPGDIEAAALAAAGVELACCIYDHERAMPVLFYTGDAERLAVVRSLKQGLPSYMVPRRVERLDRMPLVQSGKLDRQALRSYL